MQTGNTLGVVIIGRNEGARLEACIRSIPPDFRPATVYVDSGSTDNSIPLAQQLGVQVVELDTHQPFTAARARNFGFEALLKTHPEIDFVQFIDGDCRLHETWLEKAIAFLTKEDDYAICCGRRKESRPEQSIYNWLCDVEWDTPCGDTEACGGDFLVRTEDFRAVNGFNEQLIAGEEPDLCFRLRQAGRRIRRLDALMTFHDANITSFRQWFRRGVRSGYAYSEAVLRYRHLPQAYWRIDFLRFLFWGTFLPGTIALGSLFSHHTLWGLLLYPASIIRTWIKQRHLAHPLAYAGFMMLAKFAESAGFLTFTFRRITRQRHTLIEYK